MFDEPVFKILARNDTGSARGHQGGMVIPKELEDYLPDILGVTSQNQPTADQEIEAELFLNGAYKGTVSTRYQYQTWGGARSPERRLTGNLGPIRDFADRGDILLIERSIEDALHFRISIETASSPLYAKLLTLAAGRSWGPLRPQAAPAPNSAVSSALASIRQREIGPFVLIDPTRPVSLSLVAKKVRTQAFRKRLLELYDRRCAASGIAIERPPSVSGLDAAHVVPVEAGGTDDPRNGLLLAKDIHWAFDNGLVVVSEQRTVSIPDLVRTIPANDHLRSLHGRPLLDPLQVALRPELSALAWHREASMQKLAARNAH